MKIPYLDGPALHTVKLSAYTGAVATTGKCVAAEIWRHQLGA